MLAVPLVQFDGQRVVPRVVSEVRKSCPAAPRETIRPRITGELLVICGEEQRWWPSKVKVCAGQLHVGGAGGLRLPLRHLSLAAGPLPNSLALYKGNNLIITLQMSSERAFDLWVKTIAIELIRQTPLDAVRYLDILTFTECWNKKALNEGTDWNCNEVTMNEVSPPVELPMRATSPLAASPPTEPMATPPADLVTVDVLLKKCQNAENYVPVREKLMLFESLCRLGRKVRSTEDVSGEERVTGTKKAMSMHDLSNCTNSTQGVRQICKYFEDKASKYGTIIRTNRRLIHSDSQLDAVQAAGRRHLNANLNASYA